MLSDQQIGHLFRLLEIPLERAAEGSPILIPCPFRQLHTQPARRTDARLYFDECPTVWCFHAHCEEERRELNRMLRAALGVVLSPGLSFHSATNQALADEVAKSRDEILRQFWKRSLALTTINLTPVEFVARLFRPEDIVWIGRKTSSGKKVHATNFRSITDWQRSPPRAAAWSYTTGCTFKPGSYSRCAETVQERIYLVLESDELSIKDTVAMFGWAQKVLGLKLMAIVFSGGSSAHGWFFAPAEDWIDEFKQVLVAAGFCSGPLHLAQPVRLGGARRENGNLQTVLWLHPLIV